MKSIKGIGHGTQRFKTQMKLANQSLKFYKG